MKILVINDIHFSMTPPRSRLDTYGKDVLRKLKYCVSLATKEGVECVILTGDIFHRKNEENIGVYALTKMFRSFRIPVYAVLGNHDIDAGNSSTFNRRPVGILEAAKVINLIEDKEIRLNREGKSIRITGCNYGYSHDQGYEDVYTSVCREADVEIRAVHGMILLPGFDIPTTDKVQVEDLDLTNIDVLLIGHPHFDQGVYRSKSGCFVVAPGSLTRGSIAESDIKRKPKVSIVSISSKDIEVRVYEVPCKRVEEVFEVEMVKKEKQRVKELEEFVQSLDITMNEDVNDGFNWVLDLLDAVDPSLRKEVREEVSNQLRRVGVGV